MFKDLSVEYEGYYVIDCFLGEFKPAMSFVSNRTSSLIIHMIYSGADCRLAPNQWETYLQSSAFSHWLGTNLESAFYSNEKQSPTVLCVVSFKCNINEFIYIFIHVFVWFFVYFWGVHFELFLAIKLRARMIFIGPTSMYLGRVWVITTQK